MGNDLKGFFQKNTPDGWEFVPDNYSDWRSRQLNDWLVTIVAPRGLPKNVNKDEVELYCGAVQPSWLTSEEILAASLPEKPGELLLEFVSETKCLHNLYGVVRYIYAFDC